MKSVSQNLSRLTRQIVARRVESVLQPGEVLAAIEDCTHKIVANALDQALQDELSGQLGRAPYERASQPQYRNGFKLSRVLGITGWLTLHRPVLRGATPPSALLIAMKRGAKGLVGFLAARFWLRGASTRAVAQELNTAYGTKLRPCDVSTLTSALLPEIQQWLSRPVPKDIRYLYLDALYLPAKKLGFTTSQALLAALGLDSSGHVHVLGFLFGDREDKDTWAAFLKELLARGLNRSALRLAVSDEHKAILAAVAEVLGVPHQLCLVHKMRNVRARVAARDRRAFLEAFKAVFWAESRELAHEALGRLKARWEGSYPKAVALTEANWGLCLAFMAEPRSLWTVLRSTNLIERFNRELRRRLRPAGAMMNEAEVWKLVWIVSTEQEKRWQNHRVHGAKRWVNSRLQAAA